MKPRKEVFVEIINDGPVTTVKLNDIDLSMCLSGVEFQHIGNNLPVVKLTICPDGTKLGTCMYSYRSAPKE